MIARLWHGVVRPEKSDAYYEYLLRTGIPEYQSTPGNLGVQILTRTDESGTHFLLISHWESYDAIKKFAGDDVEVAHYYPEDESFLLEMERTVTHYEVLPVDGNVNDTRV